MSFAGRNLHEREQGALLAALTADFSGMKRLVRELSVGELYALDDALTELVEAVDTRLLEPGLWPRS